MPMAFTTPDERLAAPSKNNIAIFGPSGVGKTYLARSLPPATTLFLDAESGMKAVGDWRGDSADLRGMAASLRLHPWELCRAFASLLAGPDFSDYELHPAGRVPGPYSPEMHDQYVSVLGDPAELFAKYATVFVDSITVASRWSFAWSNAQPESISDKGKKDTRGTYGLHGREMIRWLTQLQHSKKSIVIVGILDRGEDDMKRLTWTPQIEGGKAGRELPGIFDNVMTLARFKQTEEGLIFDPVEGSIRGLVTGLLNPWGLPAKDRSGALELVEPPDLGAILAKIQSASANPSAI